MSQKSLKEVVEDLKTRYSGIEVLEKEIIIVPTEVLVEFMQSIKDEYGFNYLTNVTAADYSEHIEVVYDVSVIGEPDMLHVKTKIDRNNPVVPSMVPIWGGAIWQEREVYDLLGVTFKGHPDLRRILLDDAWEGYPLRRDYQWEGGRE